MNTDQTAASTLGAVNVPQFDGILFFPVTPFGDAGRVDEDLLYEHIATRVAQAAGGVFVACGTGEFHALGLADYEAAVRAGVAAAGGKVPVFAGLGGTFGNAREMVAIAEDAGVDGFLILPPYLIQGPEDGVAEYFEQLAAATRLPVIAYHRGQAKMTLPIVERLCAVPNLIGIKDGVGDVALAQQFVSAARRLGRADIQFFNGLLTAEASQAAYRAIGVPLYSSAVFAMAPQIANAFYRAYWADDVQAQNALLDEFYTPLIKLRDSTPGFAVSLVKAGLRLSGAKVGSVRPPLTDPTPQQEAALEALLARGFEMVA